MPERSSVLPLLVDITDLADQFQSYHLGETPSTYKPSRSGLSMRGFTAGQSRAKA